MGVCISELFPHSCASTFPDCPESQGDQLCSRSACVDMLCLCCHGASFSEHIGNVCPATLGTCTGAWGIRGGARRCEALWDVQRWAILERVRARDFWSRVLGCSRTLLLTFPFPVHHSFPQTEIWPLEGSSHPSLSRAASFLEQKGATVQGGSLL